MSNNLVVEHFNTHFTFLASPILNHGLYKRCGVNHGLYKYTEMIFFELTRGETYIQSSEITIILHGTIRTTTNQKDLVAI
jgi:hypothetical protein